MREKNIGEGPLERTVQYIYAPWQIVLSDAKS